MTFSWEEIVASLSALVGGALWTGKLHQRVNQHERAIADIHNELASQTKMLTDTKVSVGEVNGKLDILVKAHTANHSARE